jgi:hypothetical protein
MANCYHPNFLMVHCYHPNFLMAVIPPVHCYHQSFLRANFAGVLFWLEPVGEQAGCMRADLFVASEAVPAE